ncbi:SMI1/KNR4 family protein [Phycisphaeraceae bacterium D3-23]
MTNEEVNQIERELGIELPQSYRSAVVNMPIRAYDGTAYADVWYSADEIVGRNRELRSKRKWPNNLFFFGTDGGGWQHALHLPTGSVHIIEFEDIASFREQNTQPNGESYIIFAQWYSDFIKEYEAAQGVPFDSDERPADGTGGCGGWACCLSFVVGIAVFCALAIFGAMTALGY